MNIKLDYDQFEKLATYLKSIVDELEEINAKLSTIPQDEVAVRPLRDLSKYPEQEEDWFNHVNDCACQDCSNHKRRIVNPRGERLRQRLLNPEVKKPLPTEDEQICSPGCLCAECDGTTYQGAW